MATEAQPDPGSDAARAAGCECNPADNGVTHPTAGEPIEDHHGVAVEPAGGWVVEASCPLHGGQR